ncbi:MAG: UDP-glucose--hexose-1-phosphate uridylyltransferase [Atopobiaceae bacterium]|jgi:UDPglucose--hexose-1-phosphate uridylyltransferase|nr:UDP-glucose--hexose-1-phosphate uridylyltransferase [Atopobiaceae bacterium]MCH4180196.1 UDP-glucose--hexose-1-phosphate uridylyltransferase [Atopobiaceae bacterium]MCH4214366.1 UDP-glucose--hexose-1-phosphate uridylyltransferase [Atopobiaceae bacterium]MCH4229203.1 UDP-glucose--hexose-1-phosphate uridylyltransferase [Atopobiaceae bacterium]MCH4276574.1 UDP-glucose--hexose-1-phosphate uridylyltransferase [Atopobiaceae bacterium]
MASIDLARTISLLVDYTVANGLVEEGDRLWAYNQVLEVVGSMGPGPDVSHMDFSSAFDLDATLACLSDVAVTNGRYEDTASGRDRASMAIMGRLMPRPSEVDATFERLRAVSPKDATDWFYRLSCDVGYVRRSAIARNVAWSTPTQWGDLEITINLSKPEKDPRDIAAAGAAHDTGEAYPACQLCMTNEGYAGRAAAAPGGSHPARQNLRIVPIELGGERWGLQYSPYAYFAEHCIAMSPIHRPMHVDEGNLSRLLDFVDLFPRYFVGSNADLPIVGGSILSHDHFQGGLHTFPMMRAPEVRRVRLEGFDDVGCHEVKWPLSVLRVSGTDRSRVLAAATHVIDAWRGYSDPSAGIVAATGETRHNTVTPIVWRRGDEYVIDLALRCNVTTPDHPLGTFHPHEQWHHIKRENIGLIEVMGLAILPGRLQAELAAVRSHLLDGTSLEDDPLAAAHATWAHEVAGRHPDLAADDADATLRDEVGQVFGHVLEDAGVFKWDEEGRAASARFTDGL